MFLLRNVRDSDLSDLYELSQLVNFINLPADKNEIKKRIALAKKSFDHPHKSFFKNYYIFVLEDTIHKKVIGTSMIHAQHGTEEIPHYFLKVGKEHRFSSTLNTGFVHGTLKLGLETDGPSEIGGLILHPEYRKNTERFGKQLSFVRFLYMAIYPERFKQEILSELLPPFDKDGNSPLWEAIGRKFMNMNYIDADRLSQVNKEFILNLFPTEIIYTTLLPVEARNSIGQVGEETRPVKKMLTEVGFHYTHEVDPFDGGPHYKCPLKEILPIKEKKCCSIKFKSVKDFTKEEYFLLQLPSDAGNFMAVRVAAEHNGQNLFIDDSYQKTFPNLENLILTAIPLYNS